MPKTKYTSGTTIVTADVANSWFGGLAGTTEALSLPADDPRVIGHQHDGQDRDGSSAKINLANHVTGELGTANLGDSAVTTVKVADGAITPVKLGFSITDPIIGPEAFVFRPGGTREGNIYNDFSELYVDLSSSAGLKVLVIDDTLSSPAAIPAGSYNFRATKLTGILENTESAFIRPALTFDSGVTISNLALAEHILFKTPASGTPIRYTGGGLNYLTCKDCEFSTLGGPFIGVSGASTLNLTLDGTTLNAGVASISLNGAGIDILLVTALNVSTVNSDSISGGASAVISSSITSDSTFSPIQPSFTGIFNSTTLLSDSSVTYYDDSVALPAVTGGGDSDVQSAIDAVKALVGAAGSWSASLAVGNTSGGNNANMLDDNSILLGTGSNFDVRFDTSIAPGFLNIEGLDVSAPGAGSNTSPIVITTGDRTVTDAATGPNAGSITIQTGNTDSADIGGTGGTSGDILLATGDAVAIFGTSGPSGSISLSSGSSADASTGNVNISSGTGVNTGSISLGTGASSSAPSGSLNLSTGISTGNNSGAGSLSTGNASSGDSGSLNIGTGNALATSGSIILKSGTGATRGSIEAKSDSVLIQNDNSSSQAFKVFNSTASNGGIMRISTLSANYQINLGSEEIDVVASDNPTKVLVGRYSEFRHELDNIYNRVILAEDFRIRPVTSATYSSVTGGTSHVRINEDWCVGGTNATDSDADFSGGALRLQTPAIGVGDSIVVSPGNLPALTRSKWEGVYANWTCGSSNLSLAGAFRLVTLANQRVEFGIRSTTNAFDDATDDDKFFIRYDSSISPNWFLVTSALGVDTAADTGIVVGTGYVSVKFFVGPAASNSVSLMINDSVVFKDISINSTNGVSLGNPYIGIETLNGASHAVRVAKIAAAYDAG